MRDPVTSHGVRLLERLNLHDIDTFTNRWSEGMDHHDKAMELMRDIASVDWMYFGDYFGFKIGGDGDNGETLMYMLDILFDLYDKEQKNAR